MFPRLTAPDEHDRRAAPLPPHPDLVAAVAGLHRAELLTRLSFHPVPGTPDPPLASPLPGIAPVLPGSLPSCLDRFPSCRGSLPSRNPTPWRTMAAMGTTFADHLVALLRCDDVQGMLSAAVSACAPGDLPGAGAVHRLTSDGTLQLVAFTGFPEPLLEPYRALPAESWLPAARAVRERRTVYSTASDFPRASVDPARYGTVPLNASDAYASVPLLLDGVCLGVLSLRVPSGASLDAATEHHLHALGTAFAHRWERLLSGGDGAPAAGEPPPGAIAAGRGRAAMLELAMSNAGIGTFDWDFTTGRLVWDERLCGLFGIDPDTFDGRIETFFAALHPDDRPLVDEAVAESYRTGKYRVTFRAVRPDGTVRWLDAESRIVFDRGGEPQGMIGVAQDRTQEHERESAREARKDFVLALTRELAVALTTHDVLTAVENAALPALGGSTMALFLRDEQGRYRLAAARGFDAEGTRYLRRVADAAHRHPELAELDAGQPMLFASPAERRARITDPRLAPLPGGQAWAILPLASAHGLMGACALTYSAPRRFSADDRTVLTAASGILGQALARARLHDAHRQYLTELQHLMLPRHVPRSPGVELAVRYRPGSAGLEVGGDWYDVLPLPEHRTALLIGDVQGHSARAAAVMGQLRTAMRTRATAQYGLSELMTWGNTMLCDLETDLFATCCIAEVDARRRRLRVARAGHPYPILLAPDGRARELEVPGGMPLGCFPDDAYPTTEAELAPGCVLLLYTDGLVERRGASYTEGVTALAGRLAEHRQLALDALADRLIAPAIARPHHDDVALLLLRVTG
ncbi:SpoIIE family protein phosphatase [Streptomyces sp. JJ66]|uniref:SpoIIE family protein phosphatase n=1 Tax=Streptomyces sp. JJ66 TaxID=2803843 RepID=UPI001C576E66|nr:SpoIIE family protein phosphatase [Streptomyces sp. JJ66]MBW1600979.1 SpoIIE family protein phosphatase [Streptomyces sp. JJ66]